MPSFSEIRAGAAYVELYMRDNAFVRGLRAAEAKLRAWGASMTAIGRRFFTLGAAAAGGLLAAVKVFASTGDQLDKMSKRTGLAVEFLSALGHAAGLGGADLETMEIAIRKLQRTATDAARGPGAARDAYNALGVSVLDASGKVKRTEALFMETAAALSKYENETVKGALAQELFGRSGTALLPMLSEGREGLVAAMKEAERFGLWTTEDAKAAANLTDNLERLWFGLKRIVIHIGAALAGPLTQWAAKFTEAAIKVGQFIRHNQGLILSALKLAAAVAAGGLGLMMFGWTLSGLGRILGMVAGLISGVGTAIRVATGLVLFILSPIGLLISAVATLGTLWLTSTRSGNAMLSSLARGFADLKDRAVASFQAIRDALAAGDLALAGRIIVATLKREFTGIGVWFRKFWADVTDAFLTLWNECIYNAAHKFINFLAFMEDKWERFKELFDWKAAFAPSGVRFGTERAWAAAGREDVAAALRESAEAEHQEKLAEIEKWRIETIDALEEDRQRKRIDRARAYQAEMIGLNQDLIDAQKELDDLRNRAAEKAAEAAARARRDKLAGKAEAALAAARGIGEGDFEPLLQRTALAAGTFSAAAARYLGGAGMSIQERTAKATEETAKNTRRLTRQQNVWGP